MSLDKIEQLSKILSIVAIPVVLGIVGWIIQDRLATRHISRDYVQLAVSVLKETESDVSQSLRNWAVDLLNNHSPVKFSPEVVRDLKTGEIRLPSAFFHSLLTGGTNAGLFAMSPDGKIIAAVGKDYAVRLWNAETGKLRMKFLGHTGRVTSVAFSPDGTSLLTGGFDGTASLVEQSTGREVLRVMHSGRINSVAFSQDGRSIFTYSLGQELKEWNAKTGDPVRTYDMRAK